MRITTSLDDKLREAPDDPDRLAEALADSRHSLEDLRRRAEDGSTLNRTRLGRQLQRHGRYQRLDGTYDEALEVKNEAIEIWRRFDRDRALFLCQIQRATVHFEAGEPERALEEGQRLADKLTERTAVYRDLVAELRGKGRFGRRDYARALEHLGEALEVRRDRGNQRHIERTERMIEIVNRRGGEDRGENGVV